MTPNPRPPRVPARRAKAALSLAAAAAVLGTLLAGCIDDGEPPRSEYSTEIRRTSGGIPHVKADDEKGLGYGVGYAYAQDNACVLADFVVTVNGERARHFGAAGTLDVNGSTTSNVTSDIYYKHHNELALVQASWDRQPSDIKDLVRGYVAGFNRYRKDAGANGLAESCRGKAWVRDITELDMIRVMRRFAVEASGAQFIDAIASAQPPGATPSAAPDGRASPAAVPSVDHDFWQRLRGTRGSNGVALGRDATSTGAGLLLANPHFPWNGALRFYQMHLTIPGKVDVMGASLAGFPAVNIGYNANVAWTHTVNTSTHFTLFHLQLDPSDPKKYIVDGQSKAMTAKTIAVDVLNASGGVDRVNRTIYLTEFGPVLAIPGLLDWTSTAAYALADANADNDRMFRQWWALNKSASIDEFKTAVEGILGIPWVHAIATDRSGRAYYADVTPVPAVTTAKETACIPAPFKPLIARGIWVLAGSSSACRWDVDASAPSPGIFPSSKLPTMMRNDYVQNSNDSAWVTHPAQLLTGYPAIVSADSEEQGGRTRIGISQIQARLAGTDGRIGTRFDMNSLLDIAFSNRSYYAGVLLADLRTACGAGGSVAMTDGSNRDITKGCNVLAAWDGKAELTSIGWPLFDAWRTAMNAGAGDYWTVPFDKADPVATPRGLRVADAAVTLRARRAVATAMAAMDTRKFDYTKPWSTTQVSVRGSQRIPIHGGNGGDIYNAMYNTVLGDGQADVTDGSSIVMAISLESAVPQARGLLTYSQATNPASPYFADQTQRFSNKQWLTLPFSDAQIVADPGYSTQRLTQ